MTSSGPPVIVLGVRRSGTTLLRVMLDRSPALAIPDESYFVPQLEQLIQNGFRATTLVIQTLAPAGP